MATKIISFLSCHLCIVVFCFVGFFFSTVSDITFGTVEKRDSCSYLPYLPIETLKCWGIGGGRRKWRNGSRFVSRRSLFPISPRRHNIFKFVVPSSQFPACDDGEMMTLFDAPSVRPNRWGGDTKNWGFGSSSSSAGCRHTPILTPTISRTLDFFLKAAGGIFENWVG